MKRLNKYKPIYLIMLISLFTLSPVIAQSHDGRPIANAGSSRYAAQDPVVLDGTGSYDPDESGPLSYSWQQISGPTVVISDANTATPTISGFIQMEEIQECEFELIVRAGERESEPDTVKVVIVPTFVSGSIMVLENDSFDPNKPTFIWFDGGYYGSDLSYGGGAWNYYPTNIESNKLWVEKANIISFDPYYYDSPGKFSRCADIIIVYLSDVAPDYHQPIQTAGLSLGGIPAIDVALRLNQTYADARYAVNHVSFLDASTFVLGYRQYSERVASFLNNPVYGEQCWLDSYDSAYGDFYPSALNVFFGTFSHSLAPEWYHESLSTPESCDFNGGIVAGAYWSVIGPGKNLQLASFQNTDLYTFFWAGTETSGQMRPFSQTPGMLEPVTLYVIEPVDVGEPNGLVLTCARSKNAVGYELLFGTDPYSIMDYEIISDTPAPPNDVITTIPYDEIRWTIRVRDQYGSTIYADPKCFSINVNNPNPADGSLCEQTWIVSWSRGLHSVSYDVYFSDNYDDVNDGTTEAFRGNQTATYLFVGFAGFPYPDGLVPGTTYFWRIDDVGSDGTVKHKGKIWNFTVSP